jgi:hypothetical protein
MLSARSKSSEFEGSSLGEVFEEGSLVIEHAED